MKDDYFCNIKTCKKRAVIRCEYGAYCEEHSKPLSGNLKKHCRIRRLHLMMNGNKNQVIGEEWK